MMSALPVTEETLRALRERFKIPKFNELFGMTEVNIPVCAPSRRAGRSGLFRQGVGRVFRGDHRGSRDG